VASHLDCTTVASRRKCSCPVKLIDRVIAVVVAVHARHGDDFWVPLSSSLNMTRRSDGVGLASVFPRANCAQVVLKREQRSARLVPRAPSD